MKHVSNSQLKKKFTWVKSLFSNKLAEFEEKISCTRGLVWVEFNIANKTFLALLLFPQVSSDSGTIGPIQIPFEISSENLSRILVFTFSSISFKVNFISSRRQALVHKSCSFKNSSTELDNSRNF